jgi:hypothetical protein
VDGGMGGMDAFGCWAIGLPLSLGVGWLHARDDGGNTGASVSVDVFLSPFAVNPPTSIPTMSY